MSERTVVNQAELDQALVDQVDRIVINSPEGVWLILGGDGKPATGSSSVVVRGSSRVVAWDSSSVVARDSSRVVARGSSRVVARESSRVEARGSSRVVAWGSSRVVAWGSSSVVAWGFSSVVAWGFSSVVARESSSVEAWGSSSVEAGRYVAVHLHSQQVTLTGSGVVIDLTELDLDDPATWCDYHGITVTDGQALLYKAVDADLDAGHTYLRTRYAIGETVEATDWANDRQCGHGLHFSPSPSGAREYYTGDTDPRFLAVHVDADQMVCLDDKVKAASCRVLHEVDVHGDRLPAPEPVEAAT